MEKTKKVTEVGGRVPECKAKLENGGNVIYRIPSLHVSQSLGICSF